jgi:hypothetical protein
VAALFVGQMKLFEIANLALQHRGKMCSAHFGPGGVQFAWARVCKTDEEAEMIDCEFEQAAIPGEPYALLFEGIDDYKSDNLDNLQVSQLMEFDVWESPPVNQCRIQFDNSLNFVGAVEFSFEKYSLLITPERT